MLTEQEITLIKDLASAVGKNSEFVISQYSSWVVTSSIGWVVFGVFALWATTKIKFDQDSDVAIWAQWLIKSIVVLISATFILSSLPDVVNPKAAAIHQLIKDVSSK